MQAPPVNNQEKISLSEVLIKRVALFPKGKYLKQFNHCAKVDSKLTSVFRTFRALTQGKKMYSSIVLLASIAGAAAFAPASQVRTTSSLQMADFSKEIGAQMPLGYFDPLGIMKDADQEKFDLYRKIETKHGRIAMMAVLGHIIASKGDRMPGMEACKVGLGGLTTIPGEVYLQLFATIGLLEMGYTSRQEEIEKIHLEKSKWDAKTIERKKAIELNNGRAAQMGILGLMTHELINGQPYVLNGLLGFPVDFN
jgi:hypothetical protein